MEKKKFNTVNIIFIILVITMISSLFLISHKLSDKETQLDEVKLVNSNSSKSGMFAIMLQGEDGEYTQSEDSDFPTEGYNYNADKSGCIDSKGVAVKDVLTYTDNKFSIKTNQSVYCYVYFDKTITVDDLRAKSGNGLSTEPVGGMYRYQGTDVDNYLCLEGKCSAGYDDNMYRIIGITPEGNIKVIKQTRYNYTLYKWDTKYSTYSSDSSQNYYCTGGDCPTWEQSEIYKTLNESFYNSLKEEIKNKIEPQRWYYGDIGENYLKTLGVGDIYKIESGQKETQYYNSKGALVINEKWKQMDKESPIGLMYLHDYYYQANQESCQLDKNPKYADCVNQGWMHMKNNGGASSGNEQYEWTMTRRGRENNTYSSFLTWSVCPNGNVNSYVLGTTFVVRPVFYLKNNIQLYGSGTIEDPFTLTKVISTEQENILREADKTNTLSSTLVGGMYRYQGTDTLKGKKVNNYICLENVGTTGCSNAKSTGYDENMYRIIGITPEGNIKVIKQTRYDKNGTTEFVWDTKYNPSSSDSTYKCDESGCPEWPESEIYKILNGDDGFISTLDSGIKGKIEEWDYMYGDISYDLVQTEHITAEQVYKIETGQAPTKYYQHPLGDYITDQKWTKSKKSKIALMYIHDYAYSGSTEGHLTSCTTDYSVCKESWISVTGNDSTTYGNWTMSRVGRRSAKNT